MGQIAALATWDCCSETLLSGGGKTRGKEASTLCCRNSFKGRKNPAWYLLLLVGIAASTHAKEAGPWRKEKNLIFLRAFFSELITGLMQSTADDLARNKVYGAHSGDFVLRKLLPAVSRRIGIWKLNLSNNVISGTE